MHTIPRAIVGVLLLCAIATTGRAAPPTDVAELFPAETLAYAELHDMAAVAPQIAALVKGSSLEDSIPFIHKRRDTTKDIRDIQAKHELAILGLFTSPEVLSEFKKLRGVAVGLSGFTAAGEPEVALAILTGDSAAAGVAARAFLTLDGSVRKVATIGDVPVYQFRQPSFNYDPNGRPQLQGDKPPTEGPHELTCAYVPGLIVAGTSRAAITPVVERFQGKGKGSLRENPLFKDASATHRQPGLFFFANVPEFCRRYDIALKQRGGMVEPDAYGWFKLVANARSMRYLAGGIRVRDAGVGVTVGGAFDPAQRSPLWDFLSGPGTRVELLNHAARPATLAVAVTFPETDRAAAVIGFLDAIVKANGGLGRLPGEAIREIEAKYKIPVAEGLIGKTRAATIVIPVKQEIPKAALPLPLFVLHTESPEIAAGWEAFLPKMVGHLAGTAAPEPSSESLNGVKVFSLPGTGLPWKAAVHYARKDAMIAFGLDRKLVAAALAGDGTASVNGGEKPLIVPVGDVPALLGAVGLGGVIRGFVEPSKPAGPVVPVDNARPNPNGGTLDPEKLREQEAKARDAFLKTFDGLPPATLTARRAGNELRVELWQPKAVDGGLAPVVDAALGWFDIHLNRSANPGGGPARFDRFR